MGRVRHKWPFGVDAHESEGDRRAMMDHVHHAHGWMPTERNAASMLMLHAQEHARRPMPHVHTEDDPLWGEVPGTRLTSPPLDATVPT